MPEERFYRQWISGHSLKTFTVRVRETDLIVRAARDVSTLTERLVRKYRRDIEEYARATPEFLKSLDPLPIPAKCPGIVRAMLQAGKEYQVGPMAAVAGAVADFVGRGLLDHSPEVIVENGGDIFLKMNRPAVVGLYCGPDSPFTRRLRLKLDASERPLGVCTSSGTVGHSLSLGCADAVVAVARSAALADAAATAIGNRVRAPDHVASVVEEERARGRLLGLLVAIGKRMGAFGEFELVPPKSRGGPACAPVIR